MPIRTIEVICIPCEKCEPLRTVIFEMIKNIERESNTKILYEFKITPHLRDIGKYSINAAQTPAVVINGNVELAGRFDLGLLETKLKVIHRGF